MNFLSFYDIVSWIETEIIWGIPLLILILLVGIVLTIKLKGVQAKELKQGMIYMVKNDESSDKKGEVSSFGALCISMAATLGTGKIVGVASALAIGGPGALFWMIIAAIFGMATKYAEGFLAIRFRKINPDGSVVGGPFQYIEDGMGKKFKWLAIMFAVCGALAGVMGIGTMTQMNSIFDSVVCVFDPEKLNTINIFNKDIPISGLIITAIVTILGAIAVIGGIKRIEKVSMVLVPVMAITFFLSCLLVIIFNITVLPSAFVKIFQSAFSFEASVGAASGIGIMIAMREGISKGVFSNEAGLGSAPIALASSQSNNPVRQGLVCMSSTFIDTMVLCLTIGLGVIVTGSYENNEGINITINTFMNGLGINQTFSAIIVMFCITTFAFTTIIGWNVYGEKCMAYLFNGNKIAIYIYKAVYILGVAITPFLTLNLIWSISSIFNGLMALPNLVALLSLSGLVAKESKLYFEVNRKPKEKHKKRKTKLSNN